MNMYSENPSDNARDHETHEVVNQAGDLVNYNAFTSDLALTEAVGVFNAQWANPKLRACGELVAHALQGSLLRRYAPVAVSDAFLASRLTGDSGRAFGTLPAQVDTRAIIERAIVRHG